MKNKWAIFLICSLVALTATGVILYFLVSAQRSDGVLRVETDGETQKTLTVNALGIYPGEARDFDLHLQYGDSDTYQIELTFVETESGILREHIVVDIVADNQTRTQSLAALLDGEKILMVGRAKKIHFVYSLPIEVGNEVQGAKLSFLIQVAINKVEQ